MSSTVINVPTFIMINENSETSDTSENAFSQAADGPERSQAAEELAEIAQGNIEQILAFKELMVESNKNALVATFRQSRYIDEGAIDRAGDDFSKLLELAAEQKSAAKGIVLDFRSVDFMSSYLICKLVNFHKQAKKSGIPMRFCSLHPSINEAFEISQLNIFFSISDDRAQALVSFTSEENGGSGGT